MYGLDLFSGIGGITKALDGYVEPVAYCENDRYAQAVLLSRMGMGQIPNAPIWDDVRTLKRSDLKGPIDIIYGGFPCQNISVAGRGEGLGGKQSGLFFQIIRLVGEIRPRFVFLENVPAIRTRGGDVVAGELAKLGYDCRWDLLSAADVGANHLRKRWWLLAYAECHDRGIESIPGTGREAVDVVHDGAEEPVVYAVGGGLGRKPRGGAGPITADGHPQLEKGVLAHAERQPQRPGLRTYEAAGKRRRRSGNGGRPETMADRHGAGLQEQRSAKPDGPEHKTVERGGWWESEPNVGRVAPGVPFRVDRLRTLGNSVVPAQAREAFERLSGLKK